MEIISNDNLPGMSKIIELKVREKEDFYYYCFPKEIVEKTLDILKESSTKSSLYLDYLLADAPNCKNLMLVESKYSVEEYDESEVYAVNTNIKIEELYKVIEFINEYTSDNPNDVVMVSLLAMSELPEYKEILNKEAAEKLMPVIKDVLTQYIKMILDMNDGDRYRQLIVLYEKGSVSPLLKLCTNEVQSFILEHTSIRFSEEIKKEMNSL